MTIYAGIIVYSIVWWVLFFMILPIGVQIDPNPQKGFARSAPTNPRIPLKITITTVLSFVILILIKWIVESEIIKIF